MIIAMGILLLGLVMVASMFPVAWDRARKLSEHKEHRTAVAAADATVKSLVRVTDLSVGGSGFAGDLTYNTANKLVSLCPGWPHGTDSWVHALNLENIQVGKRQFVEEDPWQVELAPDLSKAALEMLDEAIARSYLGKQVSFHQRMQPPMRPREGVTGGAFTAADDSWDDELDARRFAWAVFHRVSTPLPADLAAAGNDRLFDIYYVTLRRGPPTYRYAKQDPASAPNPCDLTAVPVAPAPMPKDTDVVLPVAWRVQVEIPATSALRFSADPLGIPTEIVVPPTASPARDASRTMLVQMFSPGTQFIDEVSGEVYRVVKQRVTGAKADQAFLTLDREVSIEDVDLPPGDVRCEVCGPGVVDAPERRRTVWVFPPSVQAERIGPEQKALAFEGSQPVVNVDLRSLRVTP